MTRVFQSGEEVKVFVNEEFDIRIDGAPQEICARLDAKYPPIVTPGMFVAVSPVTLLYSAGEVILGSNFNVGCTTAQP